MSVSQLRRGHAASHRAVDRLRPALLDRIAEHGDPSSGSPGGGGALTHAELRQAVLRDLAWLLNAVQPISREQAAQFPVAAASVLNYGLPPLAGEVASRIDTGMVEVAIREAIVRYEPRVLPDSLSVRAVRSGQRLETHNVIEFEIRGLLWAQPLPMDLLLRTRLDLEGGHVEVREVAHAMAEGRV